MPLSALHTLPEDRLLVGLGASAGGLEVLQRFLRLMPADSGMTFLVIQHLAPAPPSLLTEILARSTSMQVVEASHGAALTRLQPSPVMSAANRLAETLDFWRPA